MEVFSISMEWKNFSKGIFLVPHRKLLDYFFNNIKDIDERQMTRIENKYLFFIILEFQTNHRTVQNLVVNIEIKTHRKQRISCWEEHDEKKDNKLLGIMHVHWILCLVLIIPCLILLPCHPVIIIFHHHHEDNAVDATFACCTFVVYKRATDLFNDTYGTQSIHP